MLVLCWFSIQYVLKIVLQFTWTSCQWCTYPNWHPVQIIFLNPTNARSLHGFLWCQVGPGTQRALQHTLSTLHVMGGHTRVLSKWWIPVHITFLSSSLSIRGLRGRNLHWNIFYLLCRIKGKKCSAFTTTLMLD